MSRSIKRRLGAIKRGLAGVVATQFEQVKPPRTVQPKEIGRSIEDRPILAYRCGTGPVQVLIVGGIHGNEVGTVKLAYRLTEWLRIQPELQAALTCHVIPCLNPDGFARAQACPDYWHGGRIGRFNARNVDLNRNFPTKNFAQYSDWSHGKNYTEQTKVFCGDHGASELEIQALLKLIQKEKIMVYFALHSAGKDVLGNATPLGQLLAQTFSKETGYRLREDVSWHALKQTGTAKEWTEEHDIAYIEIEAASRWASGWYGQQHGFSSCLKVLKK